MTESIILSQPNMTIKCNEIFHYLDYPMKLFILSHSILSLQKYLNNVFYLILLQLSFMFSITTLNFLCILKKKIFSFFKRQMYILF